MTERDLGANNRRRKNADRDAVRDVLERAARLPEADTAPLIARVPEILERASRHSPRPRREDTFAALVGIGRTLVPRLAAVAALLVLLAVGLEWGASNDDETTPASLEGWILTGSGDDLAIEDEVVVDAMLGDSNG
jgi:hypothetical protein